MARWVVLVLAMGCASLPATVGAQEPVAAPAVASRPSRAPIVTAGGLVMAVGYAGAVITTLWMGPRLLLDMCDGCPVGFFEPLPNWPVGLVPFAHPFGAIGAVRYGDSPDAFLAVTVTAVVLEVTGLFILAFGIGQGSGAAGGSRPGASSAALEIFGLEL